MRALPESSRRTDLALGGCAIAVAVGAPLVATGIWAGRVQATLESIRRDVVIVQAYLASLKADVGRLKIDVAVLKELHHPL